MRRTSILAAALLTTAAGPLTSAQAQTAPAAAETAAAEPADSGDQLEEIVVTAQRRVENAQDIPTAITSVGGETLARAGIISSTDIFRLVPNLTVNKTFDLSNPRIFLRGVGSSDFNANSSTPVGIYIDDVFVSDGSALQFQLLDIERVEVLRGPQGTLYGRNTTAGAINYISRQPTEDLDGFATLRYGNYNEFSAQGAVSGTVARDLTARLAVSHFRRDNYLFNRVTDNRTDGARSTSGRLIVVYEPSTSFRLEANVHGGSGSIGQFSQHRGVASAAGGGACSPALAIAGGCVDFLGYRDTDGDPFAADLDRNGGERVDNVGGSLKASFDLGFATLLSISAYDWVDRRTDLDNDVSPANAFTVNFNNSSRQYTQELRLTSPGNKPFNWILGGYLYRFDVDAANDYDVFRALRPVFGFNPQPQPGQPLVGFVDQGFRQRTEALAVFAHGDYALTDRLKLVGGLRFTAERGRFNVDLGFTEPGFRIPIFSDERRDFSTTNLSGDIALDYEVADDVKIYGKFARGFKGGGFNGGVVFNPRQLDPYGSELLTAYEVGLKAELFDRRVRVNLSGFYYDYQDLQLFTLVNSGGVPTSILDNAGTAWVRGIEAEITARVARGFNVNASIGVLGSRLTDFITSGGVDFTGNTLPGAPAVTGAIAADYTTAISRDLGITLRGDLSYRSSSFYTVANIDRLRQPARALVNIRAELLPGDGRWQLAAYARNLFAKRYEVAIQDFSDFGFDYVVPGDPRTFGAELTFNF